MQLPEKKTPTVVTTQHPNTAGPDSYDRSHALWVHLPIQLHAAWPVPFRLAFHCRGLVRDIPEHWGQLNEKGPLDGLLCLSPSDHGDARVGRVPEGDIARCKTDAYLTTTSRRLITNPTRLALSIG